MKKNNTVHMKNKARKVLEDFPSFHELMNNHELYKLDMIPFKSELKKYSSKQEWEGVTLAADKISSYMNGRVFWEEYNFDREGNGIAKVLIDRMKTVEVDFDTFMALIIFFYISAIDLKINNDQRLAWHELTDDATMQEILRQV